MGGIEAPDGLAKRRPSLRWRLLALVSAAALLTLALAVSASYRRAKHEIQELMDGQMLTVAQLALLSARQAQTGADFSAFVAQLERGRAKAPIKVPLEVRLSRGDGQVHAQSAGAPATAANGAAGFADLVLPGGAWRRLTLFEAPEGARVEVFASVARRDKEAFEIAAKTVQPLFVAFPALLLFIFVAVRRGLQPLESMASEVSTRTFDNLAPVASSKVPREALPLAEAIDRLLARLAAARDNERRFTADAAHELRTPLAAIRVQAQVARMAPESEARERALSNVIAGLDRATRLVEQLLRLARLDPLARLPQTETVDFVTLLEGIFVELRDHYPQAELRLEISGSDSIPGDADLLRVALRNLVDNAVRYADGAAVALFVRRDPEGDALLLGVSDDGPGVADNELTRLRERFYRSPTVQPLSGSGLGLAIVERIAELHGATLRLINRPEGGFEAALRWPSEGR